MQVTRGIASPLRKPCGRRRICITFQSKQVTQDQDKPPTSTSKSVSMDDKSALASILTTASSHRTGSSSHHHICYYSDRLLSTCRNTSTSTSSCRYWQSTDDSIATTTARQPAIASLMAKSLAHALRKPLISYLTEHHHERDAPRVNCVQLQPLQPPILLDYQSPDPTPVEHHHPLSKQLLLVRSKHEKTTKRPPTDRKSSKFCVVDGCGSRAKHARRCWKHGGSVKCKVFDCVNRAKSKGVCWSHGGGSPCSVVACGTIAVSNGFCWAHGGGKRCRERGCARPAYERTRNFCAHHYEQTATTTTSPCSVDKRVE